MRPIKFRAWDKNQKIGYLIYEMETKSYNHNILHLHQPDYIVLMQFTGLHDKNGKEIWEGDIANINYSRPSYPIDSLRDDVEYTERGIMKWIEKEAKFAFFCEDSFLEDGMETLNVEVLGDIYQNPELLK